MGSPDKQALMADTGGQSRISGADVLNTQAKETSSCFQNVPAERVSRNDKKHPAERMTSYGDFCGLSAEVWCFISLCMHMVRMSYVKCCKCSDFYVCVYACVCSKV